MKKQKAIYTKQEKVLKEWLEQSCKRGGSHSLGIIWFTPNRTSGVCLEYPICRVGTQTSWDMNWDELIAGDDGYCLMNEYAPTYEECVEKMQAYPIAVVDVVCTHKGAPLHAFEVCHKHPVSKEKVQRLKDVGVQYLYEIDAYWILSQVKPPEELKYKRQRK